MRAAVSMRSSSAESEREHLPRPGFLFKMVGMAAPPDRLFRWRGATLSWALARRRPVQREPVALGAALDAALEPGLLDRVAAGQRVALALGSRGISDGVALARELVTRLRARGATVEAIPAMGSHGGATAEGQVETLHKLGYGALGIAIVGWDETVVLGQTADGRPVHLSRRALEAYDWVIPLNRIKQHTSFRGALESGICKIATIGLGGRAGATQAHRNGPMGIASYVEEAAALVVERLRMPFALGIIEGPEGETAALACLEPARLIEDEKRWLERARTLHPALPFREIDVLIVDEMGKDISGTGLDTHVVGRWGISGLPEMEGPRIGRIGVLGLSPASRGNANGIGMVDAVTQRLVDAIDYDDLRVNTLSTTFLERGRVPLTFAGDAAVLEACLIGARIEDGRAPRLLRIRSTKHLERFYLSEALLAAERDAFEQLDPAHPIATDGEGRFVDGFASEESPR